MTGEDCLSSCPCLCLPVNCLPHVSQSVRQAGSQKEGSKDGGREGRKRGGRFEEMMFLFRRHFWVKETLMEGFKVLKF